jgi:UTP--glucose-1-phosphate uridylyltransferase
MKAVRKAVFPVAGLGTRFLPATKAMPKEMLTVVDKPLIQYAVEEAREAGVEQMIFVTSLGKEAIEAHFAPALELEAVLKSRGKSLADLESASAEAGSVVTVLQDEPLGLGHAVWCASEFIGDEPFAVLLPDDLMWGRPGCLSQMVEAYHKVGGNIVCVEEVPREKTASYGIIAPGASDGPLTEVKGLVEKPRPEEAPSTLSIIGRYILQPEVLETLGRHERGAGGEIQLTDAMAALIGRQPFHGLRVDAVRYDCGDKAGFVTANVALALEREDIGPKLRDFLAELG